MSKPVFEARIASYRLTWQEEGLVATVSRLRERDGDTTGELLLQTMTIGDGTPKHVHLARVNLTSAVAKSHLARGLAAEHAGYSQKAWADILEQIAVNVIQAVRKGQPEEELWTDEEIEPPGYLLEPLLPEREATIFFGHGATGKSYLAMMCALAVQLPWTDNPLQLRVPATSSPALWLDWETRRETVLWRLKRLKIGMGLPNVGLLYRRCSLPLADDLEAVQRIVTEKRISLVVADSLFGAIGADLREVGPAARFFTAIRSLPVTWLLITHMAKAALNDEQQGTPFGTVFFANEARSVWEIRRTQDFGAERINVGLFHRKVNETGLLPPLGFTIRFAENATRIERTDVRDMEALAKNLPLTERILYALRKGARTVADLAELLGESKASIGPACSRLKGAGKLVYLDNGMYGLAGI